LKIQTLESLKFKLNPNG